MYGKRRAFWNESSNVNGGAAIVCYPPKTFIGESSQIVASAVATNEIELVKARSFAMLWLQCDRIYLTSLISRAQR